MSEAASTGGSLADRISKPETSKTSWADEVNSPTTDSPTTEQPDPAPESKPERNGKDVSTSQLDGSTEPFGGSALHEPDYEVQVKLADIQADPNNPLFSVKTFDQLSL